MVEFLHKKNQFNKIIKLRYVEINMEKHRDTSLDYQKYTPIWSEGQDERIELKEIKGKLLRALKIFIVVFIITVVFWIIEHSTYSFNYNSMNPVVLSMIIFAVIIDIVVLIGSGLFLLLGIISLIINRNRTMLLGSIGIYREGIKNGSIFLIWHEIASLERATSWQISQQAINLARTLTSRYPLRNQNTTVFRLIDTKNNSHLMEIEDVEGFIKAIEKAGKTKILK